MTMHLTPQKSPLPLRGEGPCRGAMTDQVNRFAFLAMWVGSSCCPVWPLTHEGRLTYTSAHWKRGLITHR